MQTTQGAGLAARCGSASVRDGVRVKDIDDSPGIFTPIYISILNQKTNKNHMSVVYLGMSDNI